MTIASSLREQLLEDGFAIVAGVLEPGEIAILISSLDDLGQSKSIRTRGGIFAVRNLLDVSPAIHELAKSPRIHDVVSSILGDDAFPVRGILFDKTPNANWKVPWHQDVTIAVSSRKELDGFGPWSIKAGVPHVQPPAKVLDDMLSLRIQLDPGGAENGALKVVPGSHRHGRLSEEEAVRSGAKGPVKVCAINAGDALIMRPLLLHASSASKVPGHRRVIHLDYAAAQLPGGLRWAGDVTELQNVGSAPIC